MNGWVRLWLVFSVLLGVPVLIMAYDANSRASADIAYGNPATFWSRAKAESELSACDWTTARAEPGLFDAEALVTCSTKFPLGKALPWALLPGLILGAIGCTIAWIIRGFREQNHNL